MSIFNVDQMNLFEIKDMLKMVMRLLDHEHDRVSILQDRVSFLERKQVVEWETSYKSIATNEEL